MLSDFSNEVSQIKSNLVSAQNIVILTKQNATLDCLAGSLALHLILTNARKNVNIICPTELTVEMSSLIGVDKVKKDFGGKNIVISWNYSDGAIEKVSYNIENNRFNLIIQPRENSNYDISPDKIDFRKTGIKADLIILVGVDKLSSLNNLYTLEEEMYSKVTTINIDNNSSNDNYGKINLIVPFSSSLSELIGEIIIETGLLADQDALTNILTGIDFVTNNLTGDNLKANTLEIAAWCLRNGGIRLSNKNTQPVPKPDEAQNQAVPPSPDWLQPKIYRGTSTV